FYLVVIGRDNIVAAHSKENQARPGGSFLITMNVWPTLLIVLLRAENLNALGHRLFLAVFILHQDFQAVPAANSDERFFGFWHRHAALGSTRTTLLVCVVDHLDGVVAGALQ